MRVEVHLHAMVCCKKLIHEKWGDIGLNASHLNDVGTHGCPHVLTKTPATNSFDTAYLLFGQQLISISTITQPFRRRIASTEAVMESLKRPATASPSRVPVSKKPNTKPDAAAVEQEHLFRTGEKVNTGAPQSAARTEPAGLGHKTTAEPEDVLTGSESCKLASSLPATYSSR